MLREDAMQRQEKLKSYLYEMGTSTKEGELELKEIAIKFKDIYSDGFRHEYSDFFVLVIEVAKEGNNYSLEFLSNSMENLRAYIERDHYEGNDEFSSLYRPLMKLLDHINLEIARYNVSCKREEQFSNLDTQYKALNHELSTATLELKNAHSSVSNIQTEVISVLSIFSAVVLAFSGSMTLLGNVFSNLNEAPVFKTTFYILLCGFVISNTIFLMMYLVGKITKRNIYAKCKTKDCSCEKQCCGITRLRKRLPYIFWLNICTFLLMLIDIIFWLFELYFNIIP